MLNGAHLFVADYAARLEHHRAAGRLRVAREDLAFGDDEVHAHALNALDGLDGARQFAFQRAQPVDVLHEGGGAEGIGFVEDLVADAGRGQIVLRQLHAQLGDLVGGNHDRAAVALGLVRHVQRVELGADGGGVALLEAREQDALGRFGNHARDVEEKGGKRRGDARHDAKPRSTYCFDEIRQCLLPRELAGKREDVPAVRRARQTLPRVW